MNTPNASSLFHFTNRFDVLKAIVSDGLLYSYSYEEHDFSNFPENEYPSFNGIAIPMVCFCNTPISRVENHARVYGKYYVAIDKEFLMETHGPILNAVIYYSSENLARSIFCFNNSKPYIQNTIISSIYNAVNNIPQERIKEMLSNLDSLKNKIDSLPLDIRTTIETMSNFNFASDFILGLSKPIFGKNKLGEKVYLDEEREWRAFWMDNSIDKIRWFFYDSKTEFNEEEDKLKKIIINSSDSHLTLPSIEWANKITSICVEYENQIPELVDYILSSDTFFGCKYEPNTSDIKQFILSRITSFERLSKDI